jgi:hypothetical protein
VKMTASIIALVLIFVGTRGICSQCVGGDYYAKLQPNISDDSEGYTFNFACSTNLQTTYPRWEINNQDYDVTDLPRDFTVSGQNVEFNGARSLKVRCYINTFIMGSVDRVYSNDATIMRTDIQGYTLPESPKENVTFSNDRDVSNMHVGVQHDGGDCDITIIFSRCNNSDIRDEQYVTLSGESDNITIEIYSVEMFYEHDIIVTMNYSCSDTPKRFYIPNINETGYRLITSDFTGTIIDDLSNDYCNFSSPHIDYKICVRSPQGSNECFETPCGNGKIYTSLCSENYQVGTAVSLEVSEAENGTIVSIFCQSNDCRGKPSNVMVFNIRLLMNDENSECIKGQSVCKDNTENGASKDAKIAGGVVGGVVCTLLLLAIIIIIIIIIHHQNVGKFMMYIK